MSIWQLKLTGEAAIFAIFNTYKEIRLMELPLVSVILPTYRRDKMLQRALESLIVQTWANIQIIVIDDNADAAWNETVRSITSLYDGIKLIVNDSCCGSAKSRNIGVFAAEGDYITFLDDDDIYLPDKIEAQIKDLMAADGDYCLTNLCLYDETGKMIDRREHEYLLNAEPDDLLRLHLLYHLTGTDTFMFRADYLKKIDAFPDIDVGDEFHLMTRAIIAGGKLVYSPECHVKAYIHTGSSGGLSSGMGKIRGENALFNEKKQYFIKLSNKDVRYIKARHYAVIAFANLRMRKFLRFLANGFMSFVSSPSDCIRLIIQHKSAF